MSHPSLKTRPVQTLLAAASRGALPQAVLLHGPNQEGLECSAVALADTLLQTPGYSPKSGQHADLFWLRPSGRQRLIRVGDSAAEPNTVRHLLHNLSLAPTVGRSKVAIIADADCFNSAAANSLLKTLEEPPRDTKILLLTTRAHALLPTLRSRCQHFFISTPAAPPAPEVVAWCDAYKRWLGSLSAGLTGREAAADPLMNAFGLVARAVEVISRLAEESLKARPAADTLTEDEIAALERGLELEFRAAFLAALARATAEHAEERLLAGQTEARRRLIESNAVLAEVSKLLRYNLSDGAALEHFVLSLLRIWVARKA